MTAMKKTASKKTASKKIASKKIASKKIASKKTASKKTASKKIASKKTATKAPATKAPATKAPATKAPADLPTLAFETPRVFEAWLAEHHPTTTGIWIEFAKKGSGIPSIVYLEALEIALTYGWIDGQARSLDDRRYLQRFTPRRKQSMWSKINRDRVQALIDAGRMKPAGFREIERAKQDGRWDRAYDSPKNAKVPDDLAAAFATNPSAAAFFATLTSQNRYAVLLRIQLAKKPETRARRIETFVAMLANHEKVHP